MIKVIDVLGINDTNRIIVEHNKGSLTRSRFRIEGNGTFLNKLKSKEFDLSMLIFGGEDFTINLTLPKNAVLFNSIGMAEGNSKSLSLFAKALSQISTPVINHPQNVLQTSRDKIVQVLSGIEGVIVPGCIKLVPTLIQNIIDLVAARELTFPFLFRPVIEHGAQTLVRIESLNDMDKLQRFAFDGHNEYYMTQFFNFISSDSLYRKMRFLIIGHEVIPRHLILSESWQIHIEEKDMQENFQKQQIQEEIFFLGSIDLSIGKRLLAIKDAMGLDYVGIDCSIDREGNIVIFEANPFSMVGLGKNDAYHQGTIEHVYSALTELIKLKAE